MAPLTTRRSSSVEAPLLVVLAPDGTPSLRVPSLRQSIDAAVRRTAFRSHAPFDPCEAAAEGRDDEDALSLLSAGSLAAALEPACDDAAGPGPPSWREARAEAGRLLSLGVPLALQSLSTMLLTLVSTIFVGHLGDPVALSGVVLASSVYNVTGISLVIGLSSALDTLCGQAYGARAYTLLGVYLQRAQVICFALCVPLVALWWRIEPLLLALGQEPAIAAVAARYLAILTPAIFLTVLADTCRRYFLAQRVVLPGMLSSIVVTCLSPLYNWFFIHRLGWGAEGAAAAIFACAATNAALLNGWRLVRDLGPGSDRPTATWGGFSLRAAFSGWGQFLMVALPAVAMICCEWWSWELMILAAGWLPNAAVAISVMGVGFQVSSLGYMLPASLGAATATRVANALGSGSARGAALVFRVAAAVAATLGAAAALVVYLARRPLVAAFVGGEEAVVALGATVMPVVALSLLGDSMVAVLGCVLRGAGRQGTGAALNILGYWAFGLPLALSLGFRANLGVVGFWAGLTSAAALQAAVFFVTIVRFDWCAEVARARKLTLAGTAGVGGDDGGVTEPLLGGGGRGGGGKWGAGGGDEESALAGSHAPPAAVAAE
ncbi:hypothetical protein Rsub_11315 [Raphidocelis subcapitata]|uniref:Protein DETOXIFICATION n=1 Tax=Raphidocelis subcapitata TaxID=307507 RepID=A0A2V0PL29_9CHLO|nr:hypothetical protein Rsub_11315 [Raphidocelis subcapitata]|eukprot:GBF98590.1 hypothetical protein Rsub_11315 [Raphidocelis subcapitata]